MNYLNKKFFFYILNTIILLILLIMVSSSFGKIRNHLFLNTDYSVSDDNLSRYFLEDDFYLTNDINKLETIDNEIYLENYGRIFWKLSSLPDDIKSNLNDYLFSADIRLIDTAYRSYASLIIFEDLNDVTKNKQYQMDEDIVWKIDKFKTVSMAFPEFDNIDNVSIGINSYCRKCNPIHKIGIRNVSLVKKTNQIKINDQRYIYLLTNIKNLIVGMLLCFFIFNVSFIKKKVKNFRYTINRENYLIIIYLLFIFYLLYILLYKATFSEQNFFTNIIIGFLYTLSLIFYFKKDISDSFFLKNVIFLISIIGLFVTGFLDSFPDQGIFTRADSWSYEIIARSIAEGFGFKSYNVADYHSYVFPPLYYSVFFYLFKSPFLAKFLANIILILLCWLIIVFIDKKFDILRAVTATSCMIFTAPLWVYVPWAMTELLGVTILLVIVFLFVNSFNKLNFEYIYIIPLGLFTGISPLIRTENYMIVLLVSFFYTIFNLKNKIRVSVFLLCALIPIMSWSIVQENMKRNSSDVERSYAAENFENDYSRLTYLKKRISRTFENGYIRVYENFKTHVLKPNLIYVYDVPSKRDEINAIRLHYLLLLSFILSLTILFKYRNKENNYYLLCICSAIIFSRILLISLTHDTPRYFIENFGIIILIVSFSLSYFFGEKNNQN